MNPKSKSLYKYGYRINETGHEWWGHFDDRHNGANSTTYEETVQRARYAVEAAAQVGVKVTATILVKEQLTTVWTRWVPGVKTGKVIK